MSQGGTSDQGASKPQDAATSGAPAQDTDSDRPFTRLVVGLGGSVALHGLLAALLLAGALHSPPTAATPRERTVSFDVVEVPPPPKVSEPEPPPPPVVVEAPRPTPEPIRPPPPERRKAPEPPPRPAQEVPVIPPATEPPPSNDPGAAPDSEGPPPALNVGISMRSTVGRSEGAGMRVGVGNTMYGRPDSVAADPEESRGYRGGAVPEGDRVAPPPPTYVAPHRVSALPRLRREVRATYPEEARREGIEGQVIVRLRIDEEGRVVEAEILEGPGYGLNEAAKEALLQFSFRPATVDGRAVATDLRYVYTFLLD